MSFVVDIEVEYLTEDQARAVESSCARRGAWPLQVQVPRRWHRFLRRGRVPAPRLWVPREQDLLSDEATWDAPSWAMDPVARERFADAIETLGEELHQGFSLRAYWVGSRILEERRVGVNQLVDLTRTSRLNEFTRYVVTPSAATMPGAS